MIKQTNNPMTRLVTALAIFIAPTLALASTSRNMTDEAKDAFREGQIWATYVANPALDGYTLDVDVDGNKAVLTGTVESAIQKNLAEQVALRTEGIDSVDNRIKLDPMLVITVVDTKPSFGNFVADATISAMVDSKLLWNDYTDGLDIDVSSQFGVVTLTGERSPAKKPRTPTNPKFPTPQCAKR
ncbi:MAG: BON domain-containing protein [Xanthomonadaceae bacterium]|nr:BON domain-containing protein [Xanthomonadaceae bacterium]MDZ4114497.1 BON domain-containing protein [Xanthomonadaceae bacterium]MDZ4377053.1 BON domain-containing protein [Xanthomonadaceae bacterium]